MKSIFLILFTCGSLQAQSLIQISPASGLTPSAGDSRYVNTSGDNMSGQLTTASTLTVQGSAFSVGGSTLVVSGGKVGIGDTAPEGTQGLTINQGPADDIILSLKSSDVNHGFTTDTEADTYGKFYKMDATDGGLRIAGFNDADEPGALHLSGSLGSTDPTDSNPAVIFQGNKLSGTTRGQLGNLETAFRFDNYGAYLMTILGSGNVGIGTTAPQRKLHLNTDAATTAVAIQFSDDTTGETATDGVVLSKGTDEVFYIDQKENNDIVINTNATERMRILSGGNVGIGTAAPATKLDISSGTIKLFGTGSPTVGGSLCLNSAGNMSKCTSAVDASGNCTCP